MQSHYSLSFTYLPHTHTHTHTHLHSSSPSRIYPRQCERFRCGELEIQWSHETHQRHKASSLSHIQEVTSFRWFLVCLSNFCPDCSLMITHYHYFSTTRIYLVPHSLALYTFFFLVHSLPLINTFIFPPFLILYLRYDYRFDPFTLSWLSLQEYRDMDIFG